MLSRSRGGTGAEVNYDLMPENTRWVGEGYHGERINLRAHVLTCQSCGAPRMQQWGDCA